MPRSPSWSAHLPVGAEGRLLRAAVAGQQAPVGGEAAAGLIEEREPAETLDLRHLGGGLVSGCEPARLRRLAHERLEDPRGVVRLHGELREPEAGRLPAGAGGPLGPLGERVGGAPVAPAAPEGVVADVGEAEGIWVVPVP